MAFSLFFSLLPVCLGVGLPRLDVSSSESLSKDVVSNGQVQGSWLLHGSTNPLLIAKSSYLQFYVSYPGGLLHITTGQVEGNSTTALLYDKVPEAGDQPSSSLDMQLCDQYLPRQGHCRRALLLPRTQLHFPRPDSPQSHSFRPGCTRKSLVLVLHQEMRY